MIKMIEKLLFLSVLKSRPTLRGNSWSLIRSLRHVSTDIYPNHLNRLIQPISRGIDCKHITTYTTCADPLLGRHSANSYQSFNYCFSRSLTSNTSNALKTSMAFTTDRRGQQNSTDFRIYLKKGSGEPLSPWHDIPMFADEGNRVYNMVVEIPRWTNAKMEIATKEPLNPIKQDMKNGNLRYVRNPFPHKGYIWNYGAIPQTWEDPKHLDEATGAKGDNDPIDVIEIGSRVALRGEVLQIKVLGVMALIDEGETDWKVIAIDIRDALADQLNDIQDVEMLMPGLVKATHEWFKIYKIPDGKPANEFAFNGEAKNREFAEKTIAETHKYWKELIASTDNTSGLDLKNTSLSNTSKIDISNAIEIINQRQDSANLEPKPIDDPTAIDKWYYITLP